MLQFLPAAWSAEDEGFAPGTFHDFGGAPAFPALALHGFGSGLAGPVGLGHVTGHDAAAITVRFASPNAVIDVSEGAGTLTHEVVLSAPSDQVVTVTIEGASYRSADMDVSPQTLTFQPGQTVATFSAAVYEDTTYEGNEVFSYSITGATGAAVDMGADNGITANRTIQGYIIDDDPAPGPTVRFAGPNGNQDVSEGAGTFQHQVVLSAPSDHVVTVTIAGASYRADDMDVAPQTLTFQPGQTVATFSAAVYEDTLYEGNEVFSYTITGADGATIDQGAQDGITPNAQVIGHIIDDDPAPGPTVRFAGPNGSDDVSEGAGTFQHEVVLSAPSDHVVTVTIEGASYRADDMDVAAQTITFQPGQTEATFSAAVYEDTLYEGNEVFSYTITSADGATIDQASQDGIVPNSEVVGNIIDDDAPTVASPPPPPASPPPPPSEPQPKDDEGGSGGDTITSDGGPDVIHGNDGDDKIQGGADFDSVNGNKGSDTIDGGSGGNDWLLGGQGGDSITAHDGHNLLYGNIGNDTIQAGNGDDIVRGGQGDDSITGGVGHDWLSGDRGDDTLAGGGGADTFHTFSGAGLDVVIDFDAQHGDKVQVDAGTTYTLSQVGADTVIDMGHGDQMILKNVELSGLRDGWIVTG